MKFRDLFKKRYYFERFVQLDESRTPVICGKYLMWLTPYDTVAYTRRGAYKKLIKSESNLTYTAFIKHIYTHYHWEIFKK